MIRGCSSYDKQIHFEIDTMITFFVLGMMASAIAIVSRRAPIALRAISTLRTNVLAHFFPPENFFFPLRTTWSVYSTAPNPWGKVMLGGKFAVPGNKNTNGRVCCRSGDNGVTGCVQGCKVHSCFKI